MNEMIFFYSKKKKRKRSMMIIGLTIIQATEVRYSDDLLVKIEIKMK